MAKTTIGRRVSSPRLVSALLLIALVVGGCTQAYRRDEQVVSLTRQGEFGRAREVAQSRAIRSETDRSFMLDRMKIVTLALADGVPEAAEPIADRLYDFLRTQGVNEGNGFGAFVLGESNARVWKGEPFEQAMALAYIAVLDGMNGDWGNVRAAANNSLFQIQDLSKAIAKGEDAKVTSNGDEDLAQRERLIAGLATADKESKRDPEDGSGAAIAQLVTPVPSNFALGYVLKAVATRQLAGAFPGEAEEVAAQLNRVAPNLGGLAEQLRSAQYNTVLIVDYGMGPEKYRKGPDNAIAAFRPTTASNNEPLRVTAAGRTQTFPVVTDVNALALDLRWNNLEDVRLAKSYIGTGLVAGGLAVAAFSNDRNAQIIGLGVALLGAAMKATAGADTRHLETLPQRTYVALLNLAGPGSTIDLAVEGQPSSRLVLVGVPAPKAGKLQLKYIRLTDQGSPAWATSGQVFFANDESGPLDRGNFPYILGGRCVRTPNEDVLSSYQRSGYLAGLTFSDLTELYREEGLMIAGRDGGVIGRHVLEGGDWLFTPRAGTSGYARLYGIDRPPYVARSTRVQQVAEELNSSSPASRADGSRGSQPASAAAR